MLANLILTLAGAGSLWAGLRCLRCPLDKGQQRRELQQREEEISPTNVTTEEEEEEEEETLRESDFVVSHPYFFGYSFFFRCGYSRTPTCN